MIRNLLIRSRLPLLRRPTLILKPLESLNVHTSSKLCEDFVPFNQKRHDFQAETKKLLDIVTHSLYSDKEVFIRELVANANDAIQKLKFLTTSGEIITSETIDYKITITTNKEDRTFIIEDNGIGMSSKEMERNLGTIAKSGSKEFIQKAQDSNPKDIIGQFGVGFYASFMVADRVQVFSKSRNIEKALGYLWESDGASCSYTITGTDDAPLGTRIVLHLKDSCASYADSESIEAVLKKYSNFMSVPIALNGKLINTIQPIWTKDITKTTEDEHRDFYQYIAANTYDTPRYIMSYKTDAPLNLRCLLYVPGMKPSIFDTAKDSDPDVSLYSRKVLIMSKNSHLVPRWLRFLKGVIDSEDIPLNLSRELLQDNQLIRRINRLVAMRFLKFLSKEMKNRPEEYDKFLEDFGLYLKEGILLEGDQKIKEDICKLLKFESSKLEPGHKISLEEYKSRMKEGQDSIYFFSAQNRVFAETSPYYEAMKKRDPEAEIIYLYEPYDEMILMNMGTFDKKSLKSIEAILADEPITEENKEENKDYEELTKWCADNLETKIKDIKMGSKLGDYPCILIVKEAGALRHLLRTQLANSTEEEKLLVAQPILNLNPESILVKKLNNLVKSGDKDLAEKLLRTLFDYSLAQAGIQTDPKGFSDRTIEFLNKLAKKM